MRLRLNHHSSELLGGDFAAHVSPPIEEAIVCAVRPNDLGDELAVKLSDGGTGIWKATGSLRHYFPQGADLGWLNHSKEILSLEVRPFGPAYRSDGVAHPIKRLDAASLNVVAETKVHVPQGLASFLVLNPSQDRCAATWRDEVRWGYELVELPSLRQLPIRFTYAYPTLCPPAFSLDGRFVVSCNSVAVGWWTDDNDAYEETPSPGGEFELGVISVHDLASGNVSLHEVWVDLPEGWMPDDPGRAEWNEIWGPEFISATTFRFWLPDGGAETVSLPLPGRVQIARPLRETRGSR